MADEKAIKQYIRECWFPEHRATLTQQGNLQVLDWRKPGTCVYAVRFVFDGEYMYISGDIGEAVFRLTWEADVHSFNNISTHYFMEKMKAFSDDKYDFDRQTARDALLEWKEDYLNDNYYMDEDRILEFDDNFNELLKSIDECSCKEHWAAIVNERYNDFISEMDQDYWEWIYNIGDEVPARIYGYIVALQMASEQLKLHDKIAEMTLNARACDCMKNCEQCINISEDTPCNLMRKKYKESIWDYK